MPRRKTVGDEQLLAPTLMLPPPRPHKRGAHDVDPYESPPGAVVVHHEPITRPLTKADEKARDVAKSEVKARSERYARYLDALTEHGGDQELALADVYGLSPEEVRPRRLELQADVRSGIGGTELAEVLERNDLSLLARVNVLRKHAYSTNPAASLKALDMIGELEGERSEVGSFESFLRLAKAQKG